MSRDLFSPHAIAALVRAGDPRQFKLDFVKKRETIIQSAAEAAAGGTVNLSAYFSPVIRGRPCVSYKDYHAHLLLRGITKYLRRRLRIVLPSRDRIVRGVIETLLDGTPMYIIRRDIRSFYESIEVAPIRDRLVFDTSYSALVRKYLREFFDTHSSPGSATGLPRGTALSPLLAELALQKFDTAVRAMPGVFRYFRFSDDIIVFSTQHPSEIAGPMEAALPSTMKFNIGKRSDTYFPAKREQPADATVEFLGYQFSTLQPKAKNDSRTVRVSVSAKKINRIKSRLIMSFKSHQMTPDWSLLVDRIRFLSSNYRVTRGGISSTKDSPYVFSGIYYNYSACGTYRVRDGVFSMEAYDCAELKGVDGFYHSLLRRATTGGFGPAPSVTRLRRLSFSKAYSLRLTVKLRPERVSAVKSCWRHH